ncbi:MAG: VTT domain-containing protein [Pseudomonadota bacterium]
MTDPSTPIHPEDDSARAAASSAATASPAPAPGSAKSGSVLIRLWPVYLIIAGLVAAWRLGVFNYLSLETLREQQEALQAMVAANPFLAVAAYVAIYALVTVLMLPGALWVTIAGGLLFGLLGGSLATIAGATLGASLLFFAARTSLGGTLRERAGPFLTKMERGFQEDEMNYMFFMRLFPGVPFPVANIAPALLGAKYRTFALTTAIGIIPGVAAYTWIGAGLGATFAAGEDPNLASVAGNLLPAFAALGAVALLPVAYKKFIRKSDAQSVEGAAQ